MYGQCWYINYPTLATPFFFFVLFIISVRELRRLQGGTCNPQLWLSLLT
ncbi:hypothetical protein PHAVU_008G120800 [Phaseolus vulgaris]|uniref:Uncharacterized protein n=1 Tax=Phaseolus vulgaris TaxID=3885 RepID=V7B6P4_PHAVU|nr:hypothetical protein PHAVU_008G120800g [Phaseolus vulgaris]ESW12528.1 hypothetical protein PHAVU_008G120800g [Phaseolus vulgaris]